MDRSLAKGLAKAAILMADVDPNQEDPGTKRVSIGNMKGRKRFIDSSVNEYKASGRFLGAAARNEFKHTVIVHYGVIDLSPSRTLLAIFNDVFWIGGKKNSYDVRHEPHMLVAAIEQHALERIAQRKGERELADFLETLKPVWSWCDAMNKSRFQGRFYIPVKDGIFCCFRGSPSAHFKDRRDPTLYEVSDEFHFTRIRTFISRDRLRGGYVGLWEKLDSAVRAASAPRCPSFRRLTPEQRHAVEIMTTARPE